MTNQQGAENLGFFFHKDENRTLMRAKKRSGKRIVLDDDVSTALLEIQIQRHILTTS